MKSTRFFLFFLIMLVLPAANSIGFTIFIDTVATGELNEIPFDERLRIISMENGVMETLFDAGHIFFNVYSSVSSDLTVDRAQKEGADYYIMLKPDSLGIKWKLYSFEESEKILQGYRELEDMGKTEIDEWTRLGGSLTKELLKHVR